MFRCNADLDQRLGQMRCTVRDITGFANGTHPKCECELLYISLILQIALIYIQERISCSNRLSRFNT